MALFASWVPGNSTVAQDMGNPPLNYDGENYSDVNGYRQGNGVTFHMQANHNNWFHVPLPTPVIVQDARATLVRVMILFWFPEGASLTGVAVHDGPNSIYYNSDLNITGDHVSGGLDQDNTFDVGQEGIQWGVGISMQVTTVVTSDIYFGSAGGDFQYNI